MSLFTININLRNRKCLVVGGGVIAERKTLKLLEAGADVSVISPDLTNGLQKKASAREIYWIKRNYQTGDLNGFFLSIAATDDSKVNESVYHEASKNNILINCVDKPEYCNFFIPSIIQRGDLQIAVSTSGRAPFLSKMLTRYFNSLLYEKIEEDIHHLAKMRGELKETIPSGISDRETYMKERLLPYIEEILNKMKKQ